MKTKLAYLFSSVFNVGKLPIAPGTWGSLAALLVWLIIANHISNQIFIVIIFILFMLGVYSASVTESEIKQNDPSVVVIDEWVGQWIALLFLPKSLIWGIAAFLLFRLFDIWKPYPIRKLDEIHGGWGIMLDDVLAGIYSLIIIQFARYVLL